MSVLKITVQEALNRKKILEKRLDEVKKDYSYIAIGTATQEVICGVERDKIEGMLKSQYTSVKHLISNLSALKVAINKSNAETKVIIGGKEYTVADAIARINFLDVERSFANRALRQYTEAVNKVELLNNQKLDSEAISAYINTVLSAESKKNSELINQLTEDYKRENTQHLIDPNNLKEEATKMIEDLDTFEAEAHTALTVSNINTTIEVELED